MTKFRFLALFAALALLLTVSTTVLAQGAPKQPHVFTGEVMVGDEMAMEGTEVTATIDGETVGMAMVMDGMYVIELDPGDPSADGYMDFTGKMVMFMVGMEEVEQSETWMEGMVSPLNLWPWPWSPNPSWNPSPAPPAPAALAARKETPATPAPPARKASKAGKACKARKAPTETTARTELTVPERLRRPQRLRRRGRQQRFHWNQRPERLQRRGRS